MTEQEWHKVGLVMGRSIRGQTPSSEELSLLYRARKADAKRYGQLHAQEKKEAMAEVNPRLK